MELSPLMPLQSGTGVSVEAVDPVFQTRMLDMLKQTGRPEMVVGWYHSHVSLPHVLECTHAGLPADTLVLLLSARVWLLALQRRHQHTAIIRATEPARRGSGRRPDSVRQGQGRHRCVPADQPEQHDDGSRTTTNDEQHRTSKQADDPELDSRPEQTLLQHCHQLQEDGAGAEHAEQLT